jgi:hypothetical protein
MPIPPCAVAMKSGFQNGKVMAWHGHGMVLCIKYGRTV